MSLNPSLEPLAASRWSEHHARHLLNRAGFGVPEARVRELAALSPEEAAANLVYFRSKPENGREPNFLPTAQEYRDYAEARRAADDDEARRIRNEWQARERAAVVQLQAWWLERMTTTERPLQEKLALFWHGHFATSAQKVQASVSNFELNDLFRKQAAGNFKELTIAVGQSSAMLRYLDNVQNVKQHPNENWARELMELFTMGVGNYTETDIKESARAFTGWTQANGRFRFDEKRHDFGSKTFLGRTGDFDGWDIIDIIFEQPVTAEFIARKMWKFFADDRPDAEVVKALAGVLRDNNYDIAPMLLAMFSSRAFYSDAVIGTQIKSPVQFVVQLAAHLGLESPPYVAMARAAGTLGQSLFYPPNVKGWDGGRAWINANTLLQRYNMSRTIIVADLVEPDEMTMLDMGAMRQNMGQRYKDQFQQALGEMPEAQQKMIRQEMKTAETKEARTAILQRTLLEQGAGNGWDVRGIFAALEFSRTGECIDALAARYLHRELSREQRSTLAAALTPSASLDAPLSADSLSTGQMTSVLHLVFSLAEYQLC